MATTRHRSLVERGESKALVGDKGFANTYQKCQNENETTDIHESLKKTTMRAHRDSSKATRLFLTK